MTTFWERMGERFGPQHADTVSRDQVLRQLGGRTVLEALEGGASAREVWDAVCEAYGVWQEKSMYGRKYMGIARVTYLIDADGTVARRWDGVKVEEHAAEVLEAVNALETK